MSALLEIRDVTKRFGGLTASSHLTFGVGKGEILFKGERIDRLRPHEVCRRGIARTFQVVRPLARLTVLENVMVSAYLKTSRREEARAIAEESIAFTEMTDWTDRLAGSLPLGMRKRLEMARALATKPELLLLDENFAGLNPSEVEKTIDIVKKIHSSGVTILIIEHNMRVIMSISDRLVCINYGQKLAEGTPREVADDEQVIAAYLGVAHA